MVINLLIKFEPFLQAYTKENGVFKLYLKRRQKMCVVIT
jgi:hypothetical protein